MSQTIMLEAATIIIAAIWKETATSDQHQLIEPETAIGWAEKAYLEDYPEHAKMQRQEIPMLCEFDRLREYFQKIRLKLPIQDRYEDYQL